MSIWLLIRGEGGGGGGGTGFPGREFSFQRFPSTQQGSKNQILLQIFVIIICRKKCKKFPFGNVECNEKFSLFADTIFVEIFSYHLRCNEMLSIVLQRDFKYKEIS